jgi:hypothetical protein
VRSIYGQGLDPFGHGYDRVRLTILQLNLRALRTSSSVVSWAAFLMSLSDSGRLTIGRAPGS